MRKQATIALTLVLMMLTPLLGGLFVPLLGASSHREAPLIANDPSADGTDFYMFRSQDDPAECLAPASGAQSSTPAPSKCTITFIANYIPLQPPYGGPNFFHPADDVLYEIKIDKTGDVREDITYQFRFKTVRLGALGGDPGDTYLYNQGPIDSPTSPNLLVRTTYSLTRVTERGRVVLVDNKPIAPAFVGRQSYCPTDAFPPGACSDTQAKANYEKVAAMAIHSIPASKGGGKVFVGPRQESFYVDLGKVFDLARLGSLGYGNPVNQTMEFNTTTLALQIPLSEIVYGDDPVIGAWTTASRRAYQVIGPNNSRKQSGPFMQVSRLGSPLVNEVVIGAKDKDKFNGSHPRNDVDNFGGYVVQPRLAAILNALYGAVYNGANAAKTMGRGDLVQIFVTGIPGLTRPANPSGAGEILRLNTSIPPTASPNDFGVLGGDIQGFPNGRRVTDDVTDIELTAVQWSTCTGPSEGFGATLPCSGALARLGDGVDKSGLNFLPSFPFLPTPLPGTE